MKLKLLTISCFVSLLALSACSNDQKTTNHSPVDEPEEEYKSETENETEPETSIETETTTTTDNTNTEDESEAELEGIGEVKGSYKQDKSKVYIYDNGSERTSISYVSQWEQDSEWEVWTNGETEFLHREDEEGVYTGWPNSNYEIDILYPITLEQEWEFGYEGDGTRKVTSVNDTVQTGAGTFSNVITIETDYGFMGYYAEGVGLIKSEQDGSVVSELIELEES
ncbi:hypothetical protein MKY91_12840 [Alkalicoccobacillus gibsonii]|uniref:Lipoprotein n=1 Tax=Alkalicoccobacillus gibsonii TaxID=79881 RepID=A0ABU9VKB7_9BACI